MFLRTAWPRRISLKLSPVALFLAWLPFLPGFSSLLLITGPLHLLLLLVAWFCRSSPSLTPVSLMSPFLMPSLALAWFCFFSLSLSLVSPMSSSLMYLMSLFLAPFLVPGHSCRRP